jgi:hypothetical protein
MSCLLDTTTTTDLTTVLQTFGGSLLFSWSSCSSSWSARSTPSAGQHPPSWSFPPRSPWRRPPGCWRMTGPARRLRHHWRAPGRSAGGPFSGRGSCSRCSRRRSGSAGPAAPGCCHRSRWCEGSLTGGFLRSRLRCRCRCRCGPWSWCSALGRWCVLLEQGSRSGQVIFSFLR